MLNDILFNNNVVASAFRKKNVNKFINRYRSTSIKLLVKLLSHTPVNLLKCKYN